MPDTHSDVSTPLFPLIRHLSRALTPALARTGLTPNQITTASLVAGLGASAALLEGRPTWDVVAGIAMVLSYLLDNCDGEIARLKDLSSAFGEKYDTFADWMTHALLFFTMGYAASERFGEPLLFWLGTAAAGGATLNYFVGIAADRWSGRRSHPHPAPGGAAPGGTIAQPPQTLAERILYAFRELTRADFCFIVLALALADRVWVLLPLGAIGAQVYWITFLWVRDKHFHV